MSDETTKIWLARDEDLELYAYLNKPKLSETGVWDIESSEASFTLGWNNMPEVTVGNSPVEATTKVWNVDIRPDDITLVEEA